MYGCIKHTPVTFLLSSVRIYAHEKHTKIILFWVIIAEEFHMAKHGVKYQYGSDRIGYNIYLFVFNHLSLAYPSLIPIPSMQNIQALFSTSIF